MFSKTLFKPLQQAFTKVLEVHAANKPNIYTGSLSGDKWRHKSAGTTLAYLADANKSLELQKLAQLNMSEWALKKDALPKSVEVTNKDWGKATLEATKKYGVSYSVLNMANPQYPGGAFMRGARALEENMWNRTTCPYSLLDNIVYLDKASNTFRYNETARKLLEGKVKMTDAELEALKKSCGGADLPGYKVYFSREPRICFRGPEEELITPGFDDFAPNRHISDSARSYSHLAPKDVFPFYELRSAAPELDAESQVLEGEALEQYKVDLRHRIGAQLDTLILEKQPNVILGAWGCGAFKNDPHIVAKIYSEEIEKRAQFFQHILFPIINTGSKDNHGIFAEHLSGIKLGNVIAVGKNLAPNK